MNTREIVESLSDPALRGVRPAPTVEASAARRLRDAIEPIAMHSIWSTGTTDRLAQMGLDFMGSYLMSRALLLGRPEPGVVSAAFAVFKPDLIHAVYEQHRAAVDREELLAARLEATAVSLRSTLRDADVGGVANALRAAASVPSGAGKPLFSGLAGQPWPVDPFGMLWRACEQLREHRGDCHVAVCIAHGLGPVEMNVLTELWVGMPLGSYTASRGWSEADIAGAVRALSERDLLVDGRLTEAGNRKRVLIEEQTDAAQQPIVDALDTELDELVDQLDAWSALCVEARAFPDNPYKRAAG
jgi:hypothetical protein